MKKNGRTASLISLDGLPSIRLEAAVLLLGRSSECDVVVDSKKVSRKHCCIALVGENLIVKDLGSTNGCRVNGQRYDECRAVAGDELTIADLNYRFHWDMSDSSRPVVPDRLTDSMIERSDKPLMLPDEPLAMQDSPPPVGPPKHAAAGSSDSLVHVAGLA